MHLYFNMNVFGPLKDFFNVREIYYYIVKHYTVKHR